MTSASESAERRKTRAIARRYERAGYRVTSPVGKDAIPIFLEGFTPDLIAETAADHVIVEVRSSDAVKGANDLWEVAKRVAGESGWRFELVTVKPMRSETWTDAGFKPIAEKARRCVAADLPDVAYVYAWEGVEWMLTDASLRNGIKAKGLSAAHLVQRLVALGVLSSGDADALLAAISTRDHILYDPVSVRLSPDAVENLLSLGEMLERGLRAKAA